MLRIVITALAVVFSLFTATAQFQLKPRMPFDPGEIKYDRNGTEQPSSVYATLLDPNLTAEEFTFQFFVKEADTNRVIYTETTNQNSVWVPLMELTRTPHTQLVVRARVRQKNSGLAFYVTQIFTAEPTAQRQVMRFGQLWYNSLTDTLYTRYVGSLGAERYYVRTYPQNARRVDFCLIGPGGDTLARNNVTDKQQLGGRPIPLDYNPSQGWPGSVRLHGRVFYDRGPADGCVNERKVPDTTMLPIVNASAGWGPFNLGESKLNTFKAIVPRLACDSIQWVIRYQTGNGIYRTFFDTTVVLTSARTNTADSSASITLNMRDLFRGSQLTARVFNGKFLPPVESTYDIKILTTPPLFTYSGKVPVSPGENVVDTVTVDNLPPQILNLSMVLTSATGAHIAQSTTKRLAPAYIRSGKIIFNRKDLSLGTYVVRVRAINEFKDDAPDYFFGFDVRDTSKFFLVADSWGPHTQGDSATVTPGVVDVRPFSGPAGWEKIIGRFTLVDSLNPTVVLHRSPDVDLSKVVSRDSVVYWPDSTYQFGKPINGRVRIQTIDLPLTCKVLFERDVIYPGNQTRDNEMSHPVYVVPSPGRLTATPRLDSTFVVTTKAPLKLRLDSILPEATGVRFSLRGMGDRDPVIEEVVPVQAGKNSVEWTADAGILPVNSKLSISLATKLTDNIGSAIERTINTTPDTLSMTATPPIDTLYLEWDVDPVTQTINDVKRFTPTLTFRRIPAQTRSIDIRTYNDVGEVIDSLTVAVPYRLVYDPALQIATRFPFRAFNTTALEIRYLSDGGPEGGVRYRRNITTRFLNPFEVAVRKMDFEKLPPRVDVSPILQGSPDIVDMTLRWGANSANSTIGYSGKFAIDSVRLDILDCAGTILTSNQITPMLAHTNSGAVADTLYPIQVLPLSANRVVYHVYSKSLTLPALGVTIEAPIALRTAPQLRIPYGKLNPTYRVTDTINATLKQNMMIGNLNGVVSIDSITMYNRKGVKALGFGSYRVNGDSIWIPEFDMNTLVPEDGPYTIIGTVHTQTCSRKGVLVDTLAVFSTPRVLPEPSSKNWIYSSKGWGPFQQGRAPRSLIVVNFDPSAIISNRAPVSDLLKLSIVGYSKKFGTFTVERPIDFSFDRSSSLPPSVRCSETINFTPFDTASVVALHAKWYQRSTAGEQLVRDTMYLFPVTMLEFPDQVIDRVPDEYEQSVLAGSTTKDVMKSIYDIKMLAQSSLIDSLAFRMVSTTGHLIDTLSLKPDSVNTKDTTSLFTLKRDVGQYPYPYIARERDEVHIQIGYQFNGATRPTKVQKTGIQILPHADWLNGSKVYLDGVVAPTSIPLSVHIPMPSSKYTQDVPIMGETRYAIEGEGGLNTDLVVRAIYNPTTKEFTMNGSSPGGSFWIPTVNLFGVNYTVTNINKDGQTSGEFKALYRFEEAPLADDSDTIPNRELRIRSLYTAGGGGVGGFIKWIKEMKETVEKLIKTGTLVATGGLVHFSPTFVIDGSAKHISTINIGTEAEGSLVHLQEEKFITDKTEPDEFPTSQSLGITLKGGGGVDASLLGLIGVGLTCTNEFLYASGTTFHSAINERIPTLYPTRLNYSLWLNLELSLFFGIVNIDIFKGRLYYRNDPRAMPSFAVFSEPYESIFGTPRGKEAESPQVLRQLAKLPEETPFYRPVPKISANPSSLVTVHLEQSLMSASGRIMLSTLDTATHSLRPTAVIADNAKGIHDPVVQLCGSNGSALVAWVQNDLTADHSKALNSVADLLYTEDVHIAYYDAANGLVRPIDLQFDSTAQNLIDGKPVVASGVDTNDALVAWPAMADDNSYTDVYLRSLKRTNGVWEPRQARLLSRMPGIDRDLEIEPMNDGSYVVAWINNDLKTDFTQIMVSVIAPDGKATIRPVVTVLKGSLATNIELAGNGKDVALFYGRTSVEGDLEYTKSLEMLRYKDGEWAASSIKLKLGGDQGVFRHIEADIDANGTFFAAVDLIDHKPDGPATHIIAACGGSIDSAPADWAVNINSSALSEADKSIWSMETAIGPNNTYYIATQELDSTRDNRQIYRNGLQLGPSRCNAVIRAVRRDGKNGLKTVPFGNTPVSVNETETDKLEAALRYRMKVLDPAPNPAREACVVPLYVERPSVITMNITDAVGNIVATVFTGRVETGIQGVSFELSELASGHYSVVVTDEIGLVGSVPLVVVK